MRENGMQSAPPRRGSSVSHRLLVLGLILLSVAVLSLGDVMEEIPLFAPLVASPLFPVFHKSHDLLALALLLYIPYKYSVRWGLAAVLIFVIAHILHGFTPDEAPITGSILFVAFFGMYLIHRMHQSEGQVKQTREFVELQFYRMPIGMVVFDTNFRVQSWNPAAEMIFGFSREEMLGKHPYGLIVPKESQAQVEDIWRRLLQGDMTAHGINENTTKDGRTITCEWLNTPLKSKNGRVMSVLSTVQDITERKKAEDRIAHLTTVLRTVRSVNQLITREKDRQRLIQTSCDLLVQRQGYEQAFILLVDEKMNYDRVVSAGFDEKAAALLRQMETGNYPECVRELLGPGPASSTSSEQALIAYDKPGILHNGCVLSAAHSSRATLRCRLQHGGRVYGVLGVMLPSALASDREEQELFVETCDDIAFALTNMENEDKLRAGEIRYSTIIQTSTDGFMVVDVQGHIKDVNEAYCRLTGYSRDELLQMNLSDIDAMLQWAQIAGHMQTVIKSGCDRCETRHRGKDGRIVDVEISANYLPASQILFLFIRDVTERKRSEEYIIKIKKAVETSGEAMFLTGLDGIITFVNPEFTRLYGYSVAEVVGQTTPRILKSGLMKSEDYQGFWQALLNKQIVRWEIVNKTKDGRFITIEGSASSILDEQGNIIGFLSIQRDITEHKKAENALRQLNQELETFAYTAAHDMKAPLVTIQGFAAMLRTDREKNRPERVEEDIRLIETGVSKMQALLNKTLDYGRAGRRIEKPTQAIPLKEIIQESLEQVAGQIQQSGASISVADDFPAERVDRTAMIQVFNNLIQNSTLYRDKSRQLTIEIGHRESDGKTVYFVRDNGIGIGSVQVSKVFEPFYRGASESPGTGLGLTIVKRIIEGHGGRVWIESEPGKGTTVCFTLAAGQGQKE